MHITEKHIEINAPVERVFDFFSDFESFPRWMKNIRDVRYTGRRFTRWTAEAPLGTGVEWEAETTHFEPDRKIAWRSVRGDVKTEGEVVFEETRRGTTLMRVVLGYALPAGRLGELIARLFGKNPEQQLEDDLERFAEVVEGRRRGARRERDRDAREFDEQHRRETERVRDVGPRERNRRPPDEDESRRRFDERRAYAVRERRERDYYDADQRRERDASMPHWEQSARAGFEEAIRAARRSQLEGQRRYAAERERREQMDEHLYTEAARNYEREARRSEDEPYARDGRRAAFADEPDERQQWNDERRERDMRGRDSSRREAGMHDGSDNDHRRRPPRRHALTPRERELERERGREPDSGYSEQAFRRGVDKLMDEPPSRRWRR